MNSFGEKVRELREKKGLLLRQVAAHLEVDTAMISKIEKGGRKANKEQIIKIAEFLGAQKDLLLTLWLADKVENAIFEEKTLAKDALDIVKRKLNNK